MRFVTRINWMRKIVDLFSAGKMQNKISNLLNSVRSLFMAVGILFLTIGFGIYVDFENEAMHVRHLEISKNLEKMGRLNQELTNMLLMALYEKNSLLTAGYDSVDNDLARTIKVVVDQTRMRKYQQEISALSVDRTTLHAIEATVIKLMSAEKWEDARLLLFGDEYVMAKKTSEIDTELAVSIVTENLEATARKFGRFRMAALGTRIGALFLLLWVGVMFSRRTKADLSEQMRLRDEITLAYGAMEERVLERTADLEETTNRLAIENEERLKSDARTRLILNSAGEGILGVDLEERVTFLNDAAASLLGYTAEELIGREVHGIIHHSYSDGTPYPKKDCPMIHACSRGEERHIVGEALWKKDGSKFLSEYTTRPISEDKAGRTGAVIVFRDITERERNEEELRLRMEELERFSRLVTGREERMIQLKEEINTLLGELGREQKYKVVV